MFVFHKGIDDFDEIIADSFKRNPDKLPSYYNCVPDGLVAYRSLKRYSEILSRTEFKELRRSSSAIVQNWIYDVFTGCWNEPTGPR